jgi:hypothetical protein
MLMSGRRPKSHVAALGRSTDPTARFPQDVDVRAAGRAATLSSNRARRMISLHVHHVSCFWEATVYETVSWWIGDDRGALRKLSASGDESEQGASTPMDTGVLRIASTRRLRTRQLRIRRPPHDYFFPTCPPRTCDPVHHDPVHKGPPDWTDRLGGPLRLADGGVRPARAGAGRGPDSVGGVGLRARRASLTTPSGRAFWDGPPPTARSTCRSFTGSSGTGRCS